MAEDDDGAGQGERTPILEWVAGGIGLALTLAMLGFVGWQALEGPNDGAPAIEVSVERVMAAGSGWVVEVVARNRSAATAAAVEVEGTLSGDDGAMETSRATLDYVPGHSEQRGGLFFGQDPTAHELRLRALGYAAP